MQFRKKDLLGIKQLESEEINLILETAETFKEISTRPIKKVPTLRGRTVLNAFFEPSTRTRASFELAAKRLSADVLNLDVNTSSRKKGESILDTIYTLEAMRCDIMVVRDASAGVPAYIARHVKDHVSILNAGESDVSHPTQGLLDLLTIRRHKGSFEKLVVSIVGDIRHSRVARSTGWGLHTLGVGELRLISPPSMAPDEGDMPFARICDNLDEGLANADVVMALRIQRERISDLEGIPGTDEYFSSYGVSHERMKVARPDAIVMHPGPMNRGVEIHPDVADGPHSVILEQVTNGVAVRMAVLFRLLGGDHDE